MNNKPDEYYIEQTLKGNVNAFSHLVEKYQQMVYTLVIRVLNNKEEAEEVSQDAFVKAFNKLSTFKGESKFSTWLYKIAYFKSLDELKRKKRIIVSDDVEDYSKDTFDSSLDAIAIIHNEERKQVINEALYKLKEEDRIILTLYYFEEESLKEIAKIVNLTPDNVKIKLFRSRKKLFSLLKNVIEPKTVDLI